MQVVEILALRAPRIMRVFSHQLRKLEAQKNQFRGHCFQVPLRLMRGQGQMKLVIRQWSFVENSSSEDSLCCEAIRGGKNGILHPGCNISLFVGNFQTESLAFAGWRWKMLYLLIRQMQLQK